jgi:AcrR family transcriptional regulator
VTIDDIAAAAGLSRRSVFRYFSSKEDIVVGKFDFVADDMLRELRARPAGEPVWESLRRAFDLLVSYVDAPGKHEVAEPMQRIVFQTPALLASYLEKLAAFGCLVAAQRAWLAGGAKGNLRRRHRPRHVGRVTARLSIIPLSGQIAIHANPAAAVIKPPGG